jgi:hypothetical protein
MCFSIIQENHKARVGYYLYHFEVHSAEYYDFEQNS